MTKKKPTSKTKSSTVVSIGMSSKSDMRKWEVESAMNTLQRAKEIQNDKKLMNDVKKMASQKVKEYSNIASGKTK
jgi:hypothetical protein